MREYARIARIPKTLIIVYRCSIKEPSGNAWVTMLNAMCYVYTHITFMKKKKNFQRAGT